VLYLHLSRQVLQPEDHSRTDRRCLPEQPGAKACSHTPEGIRSEEEA
jgi:hypothetical protein